MDKSKVLEALCQAPSEAIGAVFQDCMREIVKQSFVSIMLSEATSLCGAFYRPGKGKLHRRGGSANGFFRLEGRKIAVKRPRVTKKGGGEAKLLSYSAGKSGDEVKKLIIEALAAGVSSREVGRLLPDSGRSSSTSASRLWAEEGLRRLDELRGRELSGEDFFCLMLDGVVLSEDLTALVALGITVDGRKMMLDFEIGSSENQEVCESLLNRLLRRGFEDPKERRLLVVLDGSVPLRKGVLRRFDNPVLQRCQIHKQRNIRGVLSRKHHSELAEMFKLLRSKSGAERAREVLGEIDAFLSQKSSKAIKSLREAGEDLISLQTLGCPKELHSTLLNTNAIENSINNIRRKTRRVKRWRAETDQAERWTAYGMLEAERGFRRIKGHGKIKELLEKLKRSSPPPSPSATLRPRRSAAPYGTALSPPRAREEARGGMRYSLPPCS
jgi:transposase-like protein